LDLIYSSTFQMYDHFLDYVRKHREELLSEAIKRGIYEHLINKRRHDLEQQ